MFAANLDGILSELFGDFVELNFERVTRLRRAVAALWTTRRLVREGAYALKLVTRHVIRHGLQRAGVEGARHAVTAVRAAVEVRLEVHRGDRTVVLHAGLHFHQHWMAAAMAIENLFTRESDFHRTARDHR